MKNFVSINNNQIELTEEQATKIADLLGMGGIQVQLSGLQEGETFKIGEHEFIVLKQDGESTAVIRKGLLPDSKFGDTNNYNGSKVDKICSKFADNIAGIIGAENIVAHKVDLTSNDGLKDYGEITRNASLLTAERYRRYVEILDKFNPGGWWWLATPFSTKKHNNDSFSLCVSPSGCVYFSHCSCGRGVRPFCILKSNIFVSKRKEKII